MTRFLTRLFTRDVPPIPSVPPRIVKHRNVPEERNDDVLLRVQVNWGAGTRKDTDDAVSETYDVVEREQK